MNIIVAANEKYYIPTAVMLKSLLLNNTFENHDIYFLYTEMGKQKLQNLKKIVEKNNAARFHSILMNKKDFAHFPITHHFSIETYYRFMILDIIPQTEERVLWLDVDIIVDRALDEFYYQDFEGNYLIACQSINQNPQELLDKLKCPKGSVYFNAGTILFNLELMRKVMATKDFFDYYDNNKDRITWLDQDVLNGMFALKTKIVDYKKYNMQMFDCSIFSLEEFNQIRNQTVIYHFIGGVKPWHEIYKNPFKSKWEYYASKVLTKHENRMLYKQRSKKDLLYPIRRIHGWLYEYKSDKKRFQAIRHWLNRPSGKKAYILGTPSHDNVGDSAIVAAEIAFLRQCGFSADRIIEIPVERFKNDQKQICRVLASKRDLLFWHGGGNMGDQWYEEELFRREIFKALPHNRILMFPQTLYYLTNEQSRVHEELSVEVYDGREGLTLIAREQPSYERMKTLYPHTEILLTPDIVLSTTAATYGVAACERRGVLLCLRGDLERAIDAEETARLHAYLKGYACRETDMYAGITVTPENRLECIRKKMEEFASSELVITDRLHGMVFAAITGTPCVVFSNNNHKVHGTYSWICHLPYIRYVDTAQQAENVIPELLQMKNCCFDNTSLKPYYEKIAEVIKR